MSAIVCGKRSFFEELHASQPVTKRIRFGSTSPTRYSPTRNSLLSHLRGVFPDMDEQHLERALEECGNDLETAIRKINELRLSSTEPSISAGDHGDLKLAVDQNLEAVAESCKVSPCVTAPLDNLPRDGAEWAELFVREMASASDLNDAKSRAGRILEVLEKSVLSRSVAESEALRKENYILKEQLEVLIRDNSILKRAVSIQHERQKEYDDRGQELLHLKELLSKYQEQVRTLEVNNYALTMHLQQAQQSSSIPGRFNPDVF